MGRPPLGLSQKHKPLGSSTVLAGLGFLKQIARWREQEYCVRLFFLTLPDADTPIARVAERVRQGGHNIPEPVIRRRFKAGLDNFHRYYRDAVDDWALYDNTGPVPEPLDYEETDR